MMAGLEELVIEGYDKFKTEIKVLEKDESKTPLIIMFTGSEGSDGQSWCPDCVELEAKLIEFNTSFNPKGCLVRVKVGDRDYWKAKDCPFRTDPLLKLTSVPTLMDWRNKSKRLSDDKVLKIDCLSMLYEED